MKRLAGKIALITGCNRGIGRAIMERFMAEGASIVACTRTMTDELASYYKESEVKFGIKIYPLSFDLKDEDSIKVAMRELYALKIPVDVLVNNAGAAPGGFLLLMMTSLAKMKEAFQINFFSQVLITQYVLKLMMRSKKGSIIFLTSVAGLDARSGASAYGTSKAAVAQLTKSLSRETAEFGIRVNALAPNVVETDMSQQIKTGSRADMIQSTALKRPAAPAEIANVALFLASDESSYVTGQVVRVDGGLI